MSDKFKLFVLVNSHDIIYSEDLLTIELINQFKDEMEHKDHMYYVAQIRELFNNKAIFPMNHILVDQDRNIQLRSIGITESTTYYDIYRTFLYNKTERFPTYDILKSILEKYPNFIHYVQINTMNRNTGYLLEHNISTVEMNYIIYDNSDGLYDRKIILNKLYPHRDKYFINIDNIASFFETELKSDPGVEIQTCIFSDTYDIIHNFEAQFKSSLTVEEISNIKCNQLILLTNPINKDKLEYFEENKYKKKHDGTPLVPFVNTGLMKLWDENLFESFRY